MRGRFELADVIDTDRASVWNIESYYQNQERGFFAHGAILDQGEEKWGVA